MEVAKEAARRAGGLLKERFGQGASYRLKSSHHDLITEGDRLAEQEILAQIREAFPDHGVLSEERPPEPSPSSYRWVIDPLDGTTNYAHGIPFFAVSIALEEDGQPILGVVYDPLREELFSALKGEGAYLNGRPIRVSSVQRVRESLIATGFPYRSELLERHLRYFKALLPEAQSLRRFGSAALCLAYVACGRLEGYWDLALHRWDLAAGYVLVQEAGGVVSDLSGGELPPDGRQLIATNGHIHSEVLEAFHGADAH